ncbi:PilN domain-containing protein [Kushneria aurantia]|uniref:PilN domain-containing protein n=1 Tax=Kushneria aurantia TaxID=504092 RepID=A0ABV6FZE4_9GAMM|nr:PilN domain-containing protein [Kushneria aurantia]
MSELGLSHQSVGIEINLLPWREKARERRTRQLYGWMLGCALLGVAVGFAGQQWQQWRLERVNAEVALVEGRIAALERDIAQVQTLDQQRQQMQERIRLISELQFSRPQVVALFQALNDSLVDGVVYDRVERHDGRLDISGTATTNRRVSDQMRALAAAEVFGDPLLMDVSAAEQGARRRFNLQVPERRLQGAAPLEADGTGGGA